VQGALRSISPRNVGHFSRVAKRHGLTTQQLACRVLKAPKGMFDAKLRRQANFYVNINKSHKCN
jgi:hypothetical protein